MKRHLLRSLLLSASIGLIGLSVAQSSRADELFIGDLGDDTVKAFDSDSGAYLGAFVSSKSGGLHGPIGLIFTDGQLVVVNQNVNLPIPGEVLRFDGALGTYISKLVASSDRNAPFFPQGIVRGGPNQSFYVADEGYTNGNCANQGNIKEYDAAGAFLGNFDQHKFTPQFHPRGAVFGPDGLLYVSVTGCLDPSDPHFDPVVGYILRFNASTKTLVDVFASTATVPNLHRPNGLVFDSSGNLWVTSLRADANDTDKILQLDGKTGAQRDKLELWTPPQPRAFADAILFGPGGNLFIPISSNGQNPLTAGQLRRCNIKTKACDVIVPANTAGGALLNPWYLIFRKSNPATLNYRNRD
ncbi:hypothetical protein CupriaWKF_22930 [Cupriavidus sp. WKF15]|uniref:hypothetical protein n=1 Tax=Cupriavidus sp. WKF15 TaxID=3032282 RepID=UPI0023E22762|nr:hypothetical protein [Cupriavidus sp. WKF15]WER49961.1 hypothetical protein CupriaWKF_22930 [Cupriavidus sp. WKF15]